MQKQNRALLVVSFGTTHEDTRRVTIDAIEADLAAAFPDRKLYRGWTSRMIVRRLRERAGEDETAGAGSCSPTGAETAGAGSCSPTGAETAGAGICRRTGAETAGTRFCSPTGAAERGASETAVPMTETLEEALERMAADGMTDVLVQPTHIIPGEENDKMQALIECFADRFDRIRVGRPLLAGPEDLTRLADILQENLLAGRNPGTGLVLMGHGSADKPEANRVYHGLQETFLRQGMDRIRVATVEGTPALEDVLESLAVTDTGAGTAAAGPDGGAASCTTCGTGAGAGSFTDCAEPDGLILAPLMVVAGDHAKNDMAGEAPDSWKNRLRAAGHRVIPVLRGLGEYPAVRRMFIAHAQAAECRQEIEKKR